MTDSVIGFAKEAMSFEDMDDTLIDGRSTKKTASRLGVGLGALGAAVGTAGLIQAQRTRKDMTVMRGQSRAADSLHAAMLLEARTGRRLKSEIRKTIGTRYTEANKGYRERFGKV